MNKVIAFVLGAAAGSLVTWKFVEKKYKELADQEIADVVAYYKNKEKTEEVGELKLAEHYIETDELEQTKTEYTRKVSDLGYTKIEKEVKEVWLEPGVDYIAPFTITPDEFGDKGYTTKNWTYYSDFVLTDELGNIVCEPEEVIGDGLEHFGEYADEAVFVRNENIECDYEILKVEESFSEINGGV